MSTARHFLSSDQTAAVERAIANAEKRTSAEIVVVIASQSGRYDRAEDLFGILCGLLAVALAWLLWQDLRPDTSAWTTGQTLSVGLAAVVAIFLCWFLLGAVLATRFPRLSRPLISRREVEAEVRRRGFEAFHLFRIGNTQGRSGLLIYVSLMERFAWVVGDQAITHTLPHQTWPEATRAITAAFRRGQRDHGLVEAIRLCTDALAPHFPRAADDVNELPNRVRVMD